MEIAGSFFLEVPGGETGSGKDHKGEVSQEPRWPMYCLCKKS